jgi:hypothetical protein
MRAQFLFNKARLEKLTNYWKEELEIYFQELKKDKKDEKSAKSLKRLKNHYNHLFEMKLIELYLERCKLKNHMAFFQFRKILPSCKYGDLME